MWLIRRVTGTDSPLCIKDSAETPGPCFQKLDPVALTGVDKDVEMAQNMQIPNRPIPTVELVHPKAGRVVVNEHDAEEYIAKGYRPLGGFAGKIEQEDEPAKETPNYAAMNRDQLVAAATAAGIDNAHRMSKPKLLEALGVSDGGDDAD